MEEIVSLLSDATQAFQGGDLHSAELLVRRTLTINNRSAKAWHLLSQLAERAGQLDDALSHAREAIAIDSTVANFHAGLADIHQSRRELTLAIAAYQKAIQCDPRSAAALNNLAAVYKSLGELPRAIDVARQALRAAPDLPAIRSNLLTMLLYDPSVTGERLIEEHRQLGAWWSSFLPSSSHGMIDTRSDRRIRIGYVSPDFCEHAVMRFFEPILAAHDRQRFEIFLYSECPIVDAVGERLRLFGDRWFVTWFRSSRDVATQIANDRIDILIDLAGHTRHNRLDVFSLKPAPIQASYLGYPSVTGLASIDYRLTDNVLDPPGSPSVEKLERLDRGYACFKAPADAPIVSPSPTSRNGFVTFGSHHPLLKLNSATFIAWRRILEQVPSSRLVMFRSEFEGDIRQRLEAYLDEYALPRNRIEIRTVAKESSSYLRSYDDIDIILDAFPFNGHTMTCESLWMGVPVLTFKGDRPAGRLSASVLTALGLNEFVGNSIDDYIEKGVAIAQSPSRLVTLRSNLRGQMLEKLSGADWVKDLERTYVNWFQKWSLRQPARQSQSSRTRFSHDDLSSDTLDSDSINTKDELAKLLHEGERLQHEGQIDEALRCFGEIDRREPWNPENPFRIGNLYSVANRSDEALRQYRKTISVAPEFFAAWAMMGQTYGNQGFMNDAQSCYRRAISIRPDPKAFLTLATLLPPIYSSMDDLREKRVEVENRINQQLANGVCVDPAQGPIPNFFLLAYQGGNVRDLQTSFARTIRPPSVTRQKRVPAPARDGRIRIGFVSEYFCNHTIGTLNRGFVDQLDRSKFHLTVLSATSRQDDTYHHYRTRSDRFIHLSQNVSDAIRILKDLELDVVFFADIGMSCFTLALASMRFAPVQCVTWGHPITTGLPTIDYFLSGSIYESEHADEHYTETLVKLRGLQTCYPRPELSSPQRRRDGRGLPSNAHWYGCPQTLFKFHPEFDLLIAGILQQDPLGILVLIEGPHPHWKELALDRWRRVMPDVVNRIHFLPTQSRPDFLSLCHDCDVLLDPIHFGGGNTTLEGLAMSTPVVTWPTEYLKARLAQGMLRHAGLEFLIAKSAEEYIAEAVKLGRESDYNQEVRTKISERADTLFDHVDSIRAFEDFFVEATEKARSTH